MPSGLSVCGPACLRVFRGVKGLAADLLCTQLRVEGGVSTITLNTGNKPARPTLVLFLCSQGTFSCSCPSSSLPIHRGLFFWETICENNGFIWGVKNPNTELCARLLCLSPRVLQDHSCAKSPLCCSSHWSSVWALGLSRRVRSMFRSGFRA